MNGGWYQQQTLHHGLLSCPGCTGEGSSASYCVKHAHITSHTPPHHKQVCIPNILVMQSITNNQWREHNDVVHTNFTPLILPSQPLNHKLHTSRQTRCRRRRCPAGPDASDVWGHMALSHLHTPQQLPMKYRAPHAAPWLDRM